MPFNAFSVIQTGTEKEESQKIVDEVLKLKEKGVKAAYVVAGRYDIIANIFVNSLEDLRELLYKIRGIPGVLRTETWIELRTYPG